MCCCKILSASGVPWTKILLKVEVVQWCINFKSTTESVPAADTTDDDGFRMRLLEMYSSSTSEICGGDGVFGRTVSVVDELSFSERDRA
jgi:hypothetical protein